MVSYITCDNPVVGKHLGWNTQLQAEILLLSTICIPISISLFSLRYIKDKTLVLFEHYLYLVFLCLYSYGVPYVTPDLVVCGLY